VRFDLVDVEAQEAAHPVEGNRVARDQAIDAGLRDGEAGGDILDGDEGRPAVPV